MNNLVLRILTGTLFIALVIASILFHSQVEWLFYVLFLFFTLVGTWELLKMSENVDTQPQKILPLLLAASIYSVIPMAFSKLSEVVTLSLSALFLVLIFVVELFRNRKNPLLNISVVMLSVIWIVMPFSILNFMVDSAEMIVLAMFIIIWLNDTLAYCAGNLFGKHKLFERISPKKSWEGFIIALIMTVLISISFAYIPIFSFNTLDNPISPLQWMGFAFTVVIFGTLGDLVESLFKRNCQVKDSGNILPGHGGVLDRFDSSLLAIVPAFVYWMICIG